MKNKARRERETQEEERCKNIDHKLFQVMKETSQKTKNRKGKRVQTFKTREKEKQDAMKSNENQRKKKTDKMKQKSYLRCEVLWCATEGLHGSSVCDALLTEAKISDLHMAIFIQHQVFQLEGKQNTKQIPTMQLSSLESQKSVEV